MLLSFGFDNRKGTPSQAVKVFDVRDVSHNPKSPAFVQRVQEITDYVSTHPLTTTAVGCDKGQHRSKVIVDTVSRQLRCSKFHRDG